MEQKDVPVYGEWIGTLDGMVNAEIKAQVSGYLLSQHYTEGSLVRKGQLLFALDPRPFQAVLDQAKGQLAQANAQELQAEANQGKTQLDVNRYTPLAQSEGDHRAGSRQRRPGQSRRQGPGRGGEGGHRCGQGYRRDRGAQSGLHKCSFTD